MPACPALTVCADIITSQCVVYNGANLDCSSVSTNDPLNTVISKLDALICSAIPPSGACTVKINSNDTCCGYLENKIVSDTLTITSVDGPIPNCKYLTIEERCWTFTNVAPSCGSTGCFRNNWTNFANGYQVAGYSNVKECVVKLRGAVTKMLESTCINELLFILPIGRRPLFIRQFSVNVNLLGGFVPGVNCTKLPAVINIDSNGNVNLIFDHRVSGGEFVLVSLDSIEFEIN